MIYQCSSQLKSRQLKGLVNSKICKIYVTIVRAVYFSHSSTITASSGKDEKGVEGTIKLSFGWNSKWIDQKLL